MRGRLIACLGIFTVMALSNAIVPLLPAYGYKLSLQGAIYAAYFFGAFALTLPSGILADRFGRIAIMRSGLFITVPSGILLCISSDPIIVVAGRLLEGFGAGLFVAAAMAYVNSLPEHEAMSGYYLASLNAGLVLGLTVSGFLAVHIKFVTGIAVFTAACFIIALMSLTISEPSLGRNSDPCSVLARLIQEYRWLWISAIVLIGITGVVTSLYPAFSPAEADIDSIWIAGMSISTILTSLVISRIPLQPASTIGAGSLLIAAGVIVIQYSPVGFIVIGTAAGIVMIAQMDFLARTGISQGTAMGLFSTTSYLGMSLLPFFAGLVADIAGYQTTFFALAGAALVVALVVVRSPGMKDTVEPVPRQKI